MTAVVSLVVLGLVFYGVWNYLARNGNPKAKLGPDGTNVREPETFVVHHEGKGQGLDIANTALKERTEHLSSDLPGDAHSVHAPVPGRDIIQMSSPPSDVSRYGDVKVAPGALPEQPGAETKEKVLTEGPVGSRPGTPEEPGSPHGKGRRVTDNHRDVELAADLLPDASPGQRRRIGADLAASPPTTDQEPGYGLGATAPGETDGEGGFGQAGIQNLTEDAEAPQQGRGRVVRFRGRPQDRPESAEIAFDPDANWAAEMAEELNWAALNDIPPLPADYGEDVTTVLVRNPRSLYVYWERAGFGDENLLAMLGEDEYHRATPCLRVWDVTTGAFPGQAGGKAWTIAVGEGDDHWFLNDGIEPGREYVVSYERRTREGRYYLLSQSAPVRTPHDAPAPDMAWDAASSMLYRLYVGRPGEHPHHPGSEWR
ncbi:MAG TPA: DUF4912 domain-containing protein [Symbiobacteriaceae bacterium]|nr:DUF4912 domain-containing protein [Symbiobacteriaceae bacterium]